MQGEQVTCQLTRLLLIDGALQAMLELFTRNTSLTSDAIVIQTGFDAGKPLHDSIDAMSFDDEVRPLNYNRSCVVFCEQRAGKTDLAVAVRVYQGRVVRQRLGAALELLCGLQVMCDV